MIQLSYCLRNTRNVNTACHDLWVMTHGKGGECTSKVEKRETTHFCMFLLIWWCAFT